MRTRSLTQALVGTAALLALAGCNSSSTAVESDPGELDWDVAVTRTAFLFGISPADGAYNPWQHGIVDFSDDNATRPATDEVFETGLEWLCDNFQATDASPMARIYVDAVAQEAAHAAVLATASDEFRVANSVMFVQGSSYLTDGEQPSQEVLDASEALRGELRDEWVELYELQTELEQEVFTLEGARSAQAVVAERCDVTIDDADLAAEPAKRINPSLVYQPPAPESATDQ